LRKTIFVNQLVILVLSLTISCLVARAQNVGSLQGQVTDTTGAAIAGVNIEVIDTANNTARSKQTDSAGFFSFTQLTPGTYRVKISKDSFKTDIEENVSVLVATPTRLDVRLLVGAVAERVTVVAGAAPTINTEDATVGDSYSEREVKDLPVLARNPVNLLTFQPGVVFTGFSNTDQLNQGSIASLDVREGVADGIRGNQSNVSLDGVDSNDWQNQSPFTSALPVTLDSVQEFRVTTTNANATDGLSGGAQVQLVTKSGTDEFHGSAYWYYRTTGTSANSFFNNADGIPRPKLQRNLAGGAIGGPIKKARAYFFLNNEDRRDATAQPEAQVVPTDSLRDGVLIYTCANAGQCPGTSVIGLSGKPYTVPAGENALGQATIQQLDPAHLGINPAMIPYLNLYPHGNDPTLGDGGLNFAGFRFNAPALTSQNIYIARFDYLITKSGRHSIFWRGSLQGLNTDLLGAQFPGQSAASQLLNNSRGYAVQYQGQLSANLINTTRYGFTRQGVAQSGTQGDAFFVNNILSPLQNFAVRGVNRTVPVHEINDDLSLTRGTHTLQMGGVVRLVTNDRVNEQNSFPSFLIDDGFCASLCRDAFNAMTGSGGAPPPGINPSLYTRAFMSLTGSITNVSATFFADPKTGNLQPTGAPDLRSFEERYFEMYLQDSWRIRPNLTVTYGLRYGYETPVWETNGLQVRPSVDILKWFQQREIDMNNGLPSSAEPLLSWVPAGKANGTSSWYNPDWKNLGPRLAVAYSPSYSDGILRSLFGGAGKTSLRAGAGIYYDKIGQALAIDSDLNGSPGLATTLNDGTQQFTLASAPRFAGTCSLNAACTGLPAAGAPFFTPPSQISFPFTPTANTNNIGFAVDQGLRTPYSIHFNADFQRELPHRVVLDVAYVGTLGRRLLAKIDYAQYMDIKDVKSGQDLFTADQQIGQIAHITPTSAAAISPTNISQLQTIPNIPFFTDMLPNMPAFLQAFATANPGAFGGVSPSKYGSLTPTQAFYAYTIANNGVSWACALFPLDTFSLFGTGLPSPWNKTVDPNGTGLVLFQPQFVFLPGWTNFGSSNYHSLQVGVRKSAGFGTFTANYVFSKSIDNGSGAENGDYNQFVVGPSGVGVGGTRNALIQNPFDLRIGRAVSDFNLKHNFSATYVVDLPFGHGHRYLGNASRLVDSAVGGWEFTGATRWRSGFPISPGDGFNFPTNFFSQSFGTLASPLSTSIVRNGAAGPNLFSNPAAALNALSFTLAGLGGSRNVLTGPAYASADLGLYKTFRIRERQSLQLRATAYNVFNSVNFADIGGISLDPTNPATFGNITATAGPRGGPREMEFAARYSF